MTLTTAFTTIIDNQNYTAQERALMILLYLEYNCSLSLSDNGWIDDDEIAQEAFEDDANRLLDKMRSIIK